MTAPMIAGLVLSILAAALWLDYTLAALRFARRAGQRAAIRPTVLGLVGVFSVLLSAVTWIIEYNQPHSHDFVLLLVSAHRAMMLIAGLWLAWDRRIHPAVP